MKNNIQEVIISSALIFLLVLFVNPFGFWMPNLLLMMMIVGLLVAFGIFASFIWRENARDEREGFHAMAAGRTAFLAGALALVVGIVMQSLNHSLDAWLVLTLCTMILAKIVGRLYVQSKY